MLTNGCNLESFSHLSNAFDLEKCDFFRYLQVRDYFNREIKQLADSESKLINIFSDAYKAKGNKHLISRIYKELQNSKDQSSVQVRQKWEKESGLEISEEEWSDIWENQVKTTNSRAWREFSWKNIIRFFVTPKIKFMQQGSQVVNSLIILYLGKLPDNLMAHDKYLYKILLIACKKAITRKWLRENPPSKDEWIAIVNEINCMERLTFSLRLQFDRYIKAWDKWSVYCKECNPL